MNKTVLLLMCTILCIPFSYAQKERVNFHIDSDSTHLYSFGVYKDSVPSGVWYYFGHYGEVIKSRSDFKKMSATGDALYCCLERTYALSGDTLYTRTVTINAHDLIQRSGEWDKTSYLDEGPLPINKLNKYQAKEGFWNKDGLYGYYQNGLSVRVYYWMDHYTHKLLSFYAEDKGIGTHYFFENNQLIYLMIDLNNQEYTQYAGYIKRFHPNGIIKEEGIFVFDELPEIEGEESGIWKYYDQSGNITKTDTFPDRGKLENKNDRHAVAKEYHGTKHPYPSVYLAPVEKSIATIYPEEIWKVRLFKLKSLGVKAVQVDPDLDSKFIAICEDNDMIAYVDSITSPKSNLQGYNNQSGLITLDDQITPTGYYYKAHWTNKPSIYIGALPSNTKHFVKKLTCMPHVWNYQVGDQITVVAYTNVEEAELLLNQQIVGEKKKNGISRIITWTIPYKPGTLQVNGYQNGAVVSTDSVYTPGKPYAIAFDEVDLGGDYRWKRHTVQLLVRVVDKQERLVYTANPIITCSSRNNLRILGIENGSSNSYEEDSLYIYPVYHGTAKVYTEMIGQDGFDVSVSSQPLIGQSVFDTNN